MYIRLRGNPNRFKRRGRRESIFSPKSSRIARLLLTLLHTTFSQAELAEATRLSPGYVSRTVRAMETKELIIRDADNRVRAASPGELLDAWAAEYRFDRHTFIKGHIAESRPEQLEAEVSEKLQHLDMKHAATGLNAAWAYTHFAMYRLVTIYLEQLPTAQLMKSLHFRENEKGANIWFIVPNDQYVFRDVFSPHFVPIVSRIQTYLDLLHLPERAEEASAHLRQTQMEEFSA